MNPDSSVRPAVGVVGLGQMGLRMAVNLVRAGFVTVGLEPSADARERAAAAGVAVVTTAADLMARVEFVVLSLPNEGVLEQVMTAPDGLVASGCAGRIFIDTTTTTVQMAEQLAAVVAASGGAFLDAPVTGGPVGAEQGRLSFMVGGESAGFRRAAPVFAVLGHNIVHVGPSGHGQVAKMVNQMLMAATYTAVAEAFAFAAQFGADVSRVYRAVEEGGAQSRLLTAIKADLLAGRIGAGGNLNQHGKDIDYVIAEANRRHLPLPITAAVHEFFQLARAMGFGSMRCHDLWAVWEKLLGIDLTATIREDPPPPPAQP